MTIKPNDAVESNEQLAFLRAYRVKQELVSFLKVRGVDSSQFRSELVVHKEGNERKVEISYRYK